MLFYLPNLQPLQMSVLLLQHLYKYGHYKTKKKDDAGKKVLKLFQYFL